MKTKEAKMYKEDWDDECAECPYGKKIPGHFSSDPYNDFDSEVCCEYDFECPYLEDEDDGELEDEDDDIEEDVDDDTEDEDEDTVSIEALVEQALEGDNGI
jgi:hypothetical protein